MTQPLNYCTQALETLHYLAFDKKYQSAAKAISLSVRDCVSLIHHAEKFILPEWGRIFEDDEWDALRDLKIPSRLPYPIVALEYHCDYENTDNFDERYETKCSKRIALAAETEAVERYAPFLHHLHTSHFKNDAQPGLYIMPIAFSDEGGFWVPPPATMFMHRTEDSFLQDARSESCVLPLGQVSYKNYPEEEQQRRIRRDLADEMIAVTHLLPALAIDHGQHKILPVSEKVNRKRHRKGKRPLYEYKVLDIIADIMEPQPIQSRPGGGTHASPRMHKRRGHVRHLSSGKTTWIRNSIVGKPKRGEVIKEYAVHE